MHYRGPFLADTNTKQTFPAGVLRRTVARQGALQLYQPLLPAAVMACPFRTSSHLVDVGVDENVATGQGPEILDHFIVFQCSKQGKGCVAVDD